MKPYCFAPLLLDMTAGVVALSLRPSRPLLGGKEHFREDPNARVLVAAAPLGSGIDRSGWLVKCDSYESGYECKQAIDGKNNTFWHTNYDNNGGPPPPHTIVVDMGSTHNLNGISALPRQDGNNHGFIARHELAVSTDNSTWEVVAYGCQILRLTALSEINGNPWTSVAELRAYQSQSGPRSSHGLGRWGPTINFPTVPVAGVVNPVSGLVTIWSAYAYDQYLDSTLDRIFTSTWDSVAKTVTAKLVDNTDHDMFCPGISIDGTGNMIVTGGNSAQKTTIMDFGTSSWSPGPDMNIPRGYQSSTVCSDGRIFTIGGSWSGGEGNKNGEIYDPHTRNWTLLHGCPVQPMLTNDSGGVYRADNHGWLFGWINGSVFQAGPSRAMNWYDTKSNGSVHGAGNRRSSRGVDNDAMTGNAVMFDATKGKILAFGGSPSYEDSSASTSAHLITLGDPGKQVGVTFASNGLWHARAFHTSVILPDGEVFITGGQTYSVPFNDDNADLEPEMYNPDQDIFVKMQPISIVRVYHSIPLLLPDATVFTAGGGLCGDCNTNHFDGHIYTPQYLLNADGTAAARPTLKSANVNSGKTSVTITTDRAVSSASLVRYGTATHTVNTDQRRIPLSLTHMSNNQYRANLPTDSGILLPGYYMLFVLDSKGVPSVSIVLNLSL